jgi:hypothetical protein
LGLFWPLLLAPLFEAAQAAVLSAKAAVVASKMARIFDLLFQMPPFKINRRRKAQLHELSISFSSSTLSGQKIILTLTSIEPPSTSRIIGLAQRCAGT